jgi:hypothetical protein
MAAKKASRLPAGARISGLVMVGKFMAVQKSGRVDNPAVH